jgi:hypothetical protein
VGTLQFESGRQKLWQDLAASDPKEVTERTGAPWREGRYRLPFLGTPHDVEPAGRHIRCPVDDPLAGDAEFELLMLVYLLRTKEIEPSGRWVNEKQLPGGSTFFTGPHHLPMAGLARRYGRDVHLFRRHCGRVGGRALEFGEASYAFEPLPRIPLGCVLFTADEEFPAQVTFLFDSTIPYHLPLDIVLALTHCFAVRLEGLS